MAIVDKINWDELNRRVETQQRNREKHAPVISLYRWWARRPHAVAGAILDAAKREFGKDFFLVADPFSGGGTVAFEAVRRKLIVYAQDLYPWPSLSLAVSLSQAQASVLAKASAELLEALAPYRERYWRQQNGSTWELTHVLRVRTASCPRCACTIYLYRDPFISVASRKEEEADAFFGCAACGAISRRPHGVSHFRCSSCRRKARVLVRAVSSQKPVATCPHCGDRPELTHLLAAGLRWKAILVQERNISKKGISRPVLRPVRNDDAVYDDTADPRERLLCVAILPGEETNHLLQSGFRFWSDLYTHRQLQTLLAALREVTKLAYTESIKARLTLAILGACEMPGYLCRWARHHPKAFEAAANHRYSRTTVAAETNLLSPLGRGTLPRRFQAAEKGLRWLEGTFLPERTECRTTAGRKRSLDSGVLVVTGSSTSQALKDGSVQLVLTDPPYHDDLQYGELARLFHVWMRVCFPGLSVREQQDAVPNSVRGTDTKRYEQLVTRCLTESRRTLAPDGRLVLTFHNHDLAAWTALRNALRQSGFWVIGLATVSAENSVDHSKRAKRTFLSDLVLECVAKSGRVRAPNRLALRGQNDTEQGRNLLAIGLAIATTVNQQHTADLKELYIEHLAGLGGKDRLIG